MLAWDMWAQDIHGLFEGRICWHKICTGYVGTGYVGMGHVGTGMWHKICWYRICWHGICMLAGDMLAHNMLAWDRWRKTYVQVVLKFGGPRQAVNPCSRPGGAKRDPML